ncbi:MAG: T9SS type A sorting domain-containing protein [Bacteroidota bacterium]|nr:T9SS type A sorting domain-containing protein [Bacteroidota bacterium]
MKKIFTTLFAALFTISAFSQAYNSPESIEFDYANNRWLIANTDANNILARSSASGVVSVFAACSAPYGIEIVNDTLYVNSGGSIRLFDLNTAASLGTITMGGTFLNGLTHDNTYLYSTDFSTKKIYRVNIATRAFSVFVAATGGTSSPNGIIYDQANNRCVFVGWGASAPIKAMDITTGAVTTIITSTLGNCDGITMDAAGNYYISSWSSGSKVTRYTSSFTSPTTVVSTGLSSPADLFYNTLTDTLGVPNSGTGNNTTYHYFGSATGIEDSPVDEIFSLSVNPNPVTHTSEVSYRVTAPGPVSLKLYDVSGKLVKVLFSQKQPKGIYSFSLNQNEIATGTYILHLETEMETETLRLVIAQ